jgi:acetoin:2,6-dichlorophenolindophenol oxidoreductase subunit alpha
MIEAATYRHGGHSRADPAKYRPAEEVRAWLERDPMPTYRARLASMGVEESVLDAIEAEALDEVDRATEAAKQSPPPPLDLVETDVWSDGSSTWRN